MIYATPTLEKLYVRLKYILQNVIFVLVIKRHDGKMILSP